MRSIHCKALNRYSAKYIALLCGLLLCGTVLFAQYDPSRYPVIPKPQTLLPFEGNFMLTREVSVVTEDKSLRKETQFFIDQLKNIHRIDLKYGKKNGQEPCIFVSADSSGIPKEGYQLFINRNGISLYGTKAGIFYGLQTLFQLLQKDSKGEYYFPSCSITDQPQFGWRGMHLDVARHFFPLQDVKAYLRYMALYKMNTFHWHLTDDQGWRIEIKKYPLLTTQAAWRNGTLIGHYSEEPDRYDSLRYGGYYTQEEIREVVRYADSLHITVVPEIEMPGHASALLAAYPSLGCTPGPFRVSMTWGVFEDVLCPKEETFTFLENVLNEVIALFPGEYIHIGGDEVPKKQWKESAFCQELIQQKGLKDEHGLQSWFVQRIVNYLSSKGRKAIGWDEILEGGLAEGAAVMSWRGEDGGIAAAKAKHAVVMTPGSHCYFDHYQSQNPGEPLAIGGYLPLEKVYSYYPVPASLNEEEKKFVLGVQANVWTEYILDFRQVQYMIFPRMAALSEVAWTAPALKNFDNFLPRMKAHMELYDKAGWNYSRAIFDLRPQFSANATGSGVSLTLKSFYEGGTIRFARNREKVTAGDSVYTGPLSITASDRITAALFDGEKQIGAVYTQVFWAHQALGRPVELKKAPSPSYNNGGSATLTDGITGRTPWTGSEWLGWWGDTLDAVIDLGKNTAVREVRLHTLQDPGSWIYYPSSVTVSLSSDGIHYRTVQDESSLRGSNTFGIWLSAPAGARYVRVQAIGHGLIEEGRAGAGYPAWLFVSEIEIK